MTGFKKLHSTFGLYYQTCVQHIGVGTENQFKTEQQTTENKDQGL